MGVICRDTHNLTGINRVLGLSRRVQALQRRRDRGTRVVDGCTRHVRATDRGAHGDVPGDAP